MTHKWTFGSHPEMPWKKKKSIRQQHDDLDKQLLAMRILAAIAFLVLVVLLRSLR